MTTPLSNLSATWSNNSIVYNAISMNVSNTGASANSSLIKISINGDSKFKITPDGVVADTKETIWIPARSMIPSLIGGSLVRYHYSTNNYFTYTVQEFRNGNYDTAEFDIIMPRGWNKKNLKFRVAASPKTQRNPSYSNNTGWFLETRVIKSNSSLEFIDQIYTDPAINPDVLTWGYVEMETKSNNTIYISGESNTMNVYSSPSDGDILAFRLWRIDAQTNELNNDARLFGVELILNGA